MFILWLIFLIYGCVKANEIILLISGLYGVAMMIGFGNSHLKKIEKLLNPQKEDKDNG